MTQRVSNKYWIIRYPSDKGAVVAKFEGEVVIPDSVADHSEFVIQSVASRSALTDATIDQSGLSGEEKELLGEVYPVQS